MDHFSMLSEEIWWGQFFTCWNSQQSTPLLYLLTSSNTTMGYDSSFSSILRLCCFDWFVFINIKHNVYSATGISWLNCYHEFALGNVPKCPIVATYLICQAHTIYNACWWQCDRFGWCYSSFIMSCYSWFVCFLESTITIRQCPK